MSKNENALKIILKKALEMTINNHVIPYITDDNFIFPDEKVYSFDGARISFDDKEINIGVEGYTHKDVTNMNVNVNDVVILFSRKNKKITILSEDKFIIREIPINIIHNYIEQIVDAFLNKVLNY